MRSRTRTIGLTLLTLFILAATGVLVAETALRIKRNREAAAEVAKWRSTNPEYQFDAYRQIYSDERWRPYKFGHHPNIRVKLERGYYNFTMVTNSDGLRETRDYGALPKSVIFLGDSVVEGSSVENDETMDSVFEARTGVPALNFGVASRGVYLAQHFLREKYRREYSTKLVVFGFCVNDFEEATYVRYFDGNVGSWFLLRYMDDGFDLRRGVAYGASRVPIAGRAVRFARNLYAESAIVKATSVQPGSDVQRPPIKDSFGAEAVTPVQLQYTDVHFAMLKEFTDSIGAGLVVVLLPPRDQLKWPYKPGERLQEALIPILQKQGIPHVDLFDPFKSATAADPEARWYHDQMHFYKPGHKVAGEHLAARLKEMFPSVF